MANSRRLKSDASGPVHPIEHKWDPVTLYCIRCGIGKSNEEFLCVSVDSKVTAISHLVRVKRLKSAAL